MTENIVSSKEKLRQKMLKLREDMSLRQKREFDFKICQSLKLIVQKKEPAVIHSYLPISNEIDITTFLDWALKAGHRIVCPKVLPGRQLQSIELINFEEFDVGPFSTLYPAGNRIYESKIDMVLVPGLAFDKNMNRLGYGGGYYDRFLKKNSKSYKIAALYSYQLLDSVPVEKHDIPVNELILP